MVADGRFSALCAEGKQDGCRCRQSVEEIGILLPGSVFIFNITA
jgi:hypothetical protein